ncbi:MAG: hypothetical protein P1U56_17675 [Saprospiraceae bacterium]|nr:hypothetical protein [Saprospiraceae bacterium]
MNYKSKIKGYKPEVDVDAWKAMESLLEAEIVQTTPTVEKNGLYSRIKKWFFVCLIGILFISIGGYFFTSDMLQETRQIDTGFNPSLQPNKMSASPLIETSDVKDKSIEQSKPINQGETNKISLEADQIVANKRNLNSEVNSFKVKPMRESNRDEIPFGADTSIERAQAKLSTNSQTLLNTDSSDESVKNSIEDGNLSEFENTSDDNRRSTLVNEKKSKTWTDATIDEVELTSKDAQNEIFSLEYFESIARLEMKSISPLGKPYFENPELVKPARIPTKYLFGLDVGSCYYFERIRGESISLFGVYEVLPWLRTGLRLNYSNMREPTDYTISPDIKMSRIERSLDLYTQIVPLRIWRINLGIEGGYGTTFLTEKDRILENPEPNVINFSEGIYNYGSRWFYLGAHITLDVSNMVKIGATAGTNTGTETVHLSGRIMYRI